MKLGLTALALVMGLLWMPQPSLAQPEPDASRPVACNNGKAGAFACGGMDLVKRMVTAQLGGERLNEIWGWTDPETDREYAVVCEQNGTSFVDVTDPNAPQYLGHLPIPAGAQPNFWHDVKVYKNHAFIVADLAGSHGMQIFDLTQLRSAPNPPATFSETARYDRITSAHNLAINEETGFAYIVGANGGGDTCGSGLHMVNITDPVNPTFAGCFNDGTTGSTNKGYVHDTQCVIYQGPDTEHQGKEICFTANETAITIVDVTDKSNPVLLSSGSYPKVTYAHQGWLTEDQRYFFLGDELDETNGQVSGTRTIIWDFNDLDDPVVLTEYIANNTSSDHNLYIKGNYVFMANYTSGLRVLDISDVAHPQEVAFFDTVISTDAATTAQGAWGSYPFFKSGNIIVSSGSEGLFIIRPTNLTIPTEPPVEQPARFTLASSHPNPFNAHTTITVNVAQPTALTVTVYDALGRSMQHVHQGWLATGKHAFTVHSDGWPDGVYFIRAVGEDMAAVRAVVLVK